MKTGFFTLFISFIILLNCNIASSIEYKDGKTWDFPIEVIILDTAGNPVPRVPIFVDGKEAGKTGAHGQFKAMIGERHRASIKIGVGEVEGYRLQSQQVSEADFQLLMSNPSDPVPSETKLKVIYEKVSQEHMVWIHLDCKKELPCENIKIKSGGKNVGKTNEFGVAYFIENSVPDSKVELRVDTPRSTEDVIYSPSNIDYVFKSSLEPSIYLVNLVLSNIQSGGRVDKKSTSRRGKRTSRRRGKRTSRRRSLRKRRSNKKVTKKKKKKKKSGPIDLW